MSPDITSTKLSRTSRKRRTRILATVVAVGVLGACGSLDQTAVTPGHEVAPVPSDTSAPRTTTALPSRQPITGRITYPMTGSGKWDVATGKGAVAGTSGPMLRYRVAVERDIKGSAAAVFATAVETTLKDQRSWAANGQARLQRVGRHASPDFTVYLVTPATRDELCGDTARGEIDRYTSCRNGPSVVLNVSRWVHGVPRYGASLNEYRHYMVNHEVGHRLGFGHEKCPSAGKLAPVMQQQTLGLHGCRANGWPSPNGRLHHGPAGAYGDKLPRDL